MVNPNETAVSVSWNLAASRTTSKTSIGSSKDCEAKPDMDVLQMALEVIDIALWSWNGSSSSI